MSGDTSYDHLADGMTEDPTTFMSRIPGLFVVARNSTFAYKGQSPDIRQVGKDLDVRYVLEGSVHPAWVVKTWMPGAGLCALIGWAGHRPMLP